jgi:hypothetical protein
MAKANLSSRERLSAYLLLSRLNRSFHLIVCRLSQAGELGLLNQLETKEMLGLTQEVQTEINGLVLNSLESLESIDWTRFGKVRAAMEKRLKS